MTIVPYKSVAAALVLVVLLGPIGLFYSSFLGGVIMTILGLAAIGTMTSMHSPLPMATVYFLCVVWSMAAVRRYNHKMLKIAMKDTCHRVQDPAEKASQSIFRKTTDKTEVIHPSESVNDDKDSTSDENTTSWKL